MLYLHCLIRVPKDHTSSGVIGMSDCQRSTCNKNHTNPLATHCNDIIAQSVACHNASQYSELTLPSFTDSSRQVAVHFIWNWTSILS